MKLIPMSNDGTFVMVDDEDFEYLVGFGNWYTNNAGYAQKTIDHKTVFMHHLILKVTPGREVDHIDGNPRNNQRSNLREATRQQNALNQKRRSSNTSGYIGVYWASHANKWAANVRINGKTRFLGYY